MMSKVNMNSKFPLWVTANYSKIAMSSEVKLEVFVLDLSFDERATLYSSSLHQ